jgi:large subunit ribosomal protein L18
MLSKKERTNDRARRKRRVRGRVNGELDRPRLTVYRSNRHMYAQVVNDIDGVTLAAASTLEDGFADLDKRACAKQVGKLVAERAKEKGVAKVVFDRNGYIYHGRVAAVADGAREAGLDF